MKTPIERTHDAWLYLSETGGFDGLNADKQILIQEAFRIAAGSHEYGDDDTSKKCLCDEPQHNYPEMVWCDKCSNEISSVTMKIFNIIFERELEGKEVIVYRGERQPTGEEAENIIREFGYIFNSGFDVVREIYEIKLKENR